MPPKAKKEEKPAAHDQSEAQDKLREQIEARIIKEARAVDLDIDQGKIRVEIEKGILAQALRDDEACERIRVAHEVRVREAQEKAYVLIVKRLIEEAQEQDEEELARYKAWRDALDAEELALYKHALADRSTLPLRRTLTQHWADINELFADWHRRAGRKADARLSAAEFRIGLKLLGIVAPADDVERLWKSIEEQPQAEGAAAGAEGKLPLTVTGEGAAELHLGVADSAADGNRHELRTLHQLLRPGGWSQRVSGGAPPKPSARETSPVTVTDGLLSARARNLTEVLDELAVTTQGRRALGGRRLSQQESRWRSAKTLVATGVTANTRLIANDTRRSVTSSPGSPGGRSSPVGRGPTVWAPPTSTWASKPWAPPLDEDETHDAAPSAAAPGPADAANAPINFSPLPRFSPTKPPKPAAPASPFGSPRPSVPQPQFFSSPQSSRPASRPTGFYAHATPTTMRRAAAADAARPATAPSLPWPPPHPIKPSAMGGAASPIGGGGAPRHLLIARLEEQGRAVGTAASPYGSIASHRKVGLHLTEHAASLAAANSASASASASPRPPSSPRCAASASLSPSTWQSMVPSPRVPSPSPSPPATARSLGASPIGARPLTRPRPATSHGLGSGSGSGGAPSSSPRRPASHQASRRPPAAPPSPSPARSLPSALPSSSPGSYDISVISTPHAEPRPRSSGFRSWDPTTADLSKCATAADERLMMRRLCTPDDEYRLHPADRCVSGVPVAEEIATFESYLTNRYPPGHIHRS